MSLSIEEVDRLIAALGAARAEAISGRPRLFSEAGENRPHTIELATVDARGQRFGSGPSESPKDR